MFLNPPAYIHTCARAPESSTGCARLKFLLTEGYGSPGSRCFGFDEQSTICLQKEHRCVGFPHRTAEQEDGRLLYSLNNKNSATSYVLPRSMKLWDREEGCSRFVTSRACSTKSKPRG